MQNVTRDHLNSAIINTQEKDADGVYVWSVKKIMDHLMEQQGFSEEDYDVRAKAKTRTVSLAPIIERLVAKGKRINLIDQVAGRRRSQESHDDDIADLMD